MKTETKVKFTYCIFFIFLCNIANAQIAQPRIFNFKFGDEYQKVTSINSTCTIQRGNQKLAVNSASSVIKLYKVKAVNDKGYVFTVSIQKMDDVLTALGQKLHYSSEQPLDSTSRIEKALNYMLNKPIDVTIDKHGIISSKNEEVEFANDTLLAFTGIEPELFIHGRLFDLLENFTSNKLKTAYKWTDSTVINKQKAVTKYSVYTTSDTTTAIRFTSSVGDGSVNSNTNGTYVLDNRSGIIVERFIESVSAGYSVIGKTIYVTTRSSSIHETCRKQRSNVFAQNRP